MKKLLPLLLALLLFLQLHGQSQSRDFSQVENMVFAGAGMRGVAYVGALRQVDSMGGDLSQIKRFAGSSAGSLVAMALSIGYTPLEMKEVLFSTDFSEFTNSKTGVFGGLNRTFKEFGYYKSKAIGEWIGTIIEDKTGNANITFEELIDQGYTPLYITGTSLSQQKLIIFSRETYPEMRVRDAVLISISIPLYFEPVNIDEQGRIIENNDTTRRWSKYRLVKDDSSALPRIKKQKDTTDKIHNLMVDGGMGSNLPMHIFDHPKYCPDCRDRHLRDFRNPHTLGFMIVRPEQARMDKTSHELAPFDIDEFTDYAEAMYNFVMHYRRRLAMTPADWERIIVISDAKVTWQVDALPQEQVQLLLENGRKAVRDYFKQ